LPYVSLVALLVGSALAEDALSVFQARHSLIEEHNARYEAGLESYKMTHNKFSFMSRARLLKFTGETVEAPASDHNMTTKGGDVIDGLDPKKTPKSADYRNLCSPIRNQQECGSCYAFASAAAMEVHLRLKKGIFEDVSEQDIVDCSTASHGNNGCDSGNTMKSFKYINENGFVTKRSVYPYENALGRCRSKRRESAGTVDGYEMVLGMPKEDKMAMVVGLDGPVTIMLQYMPESFYQYDGGIYDDPACGKIDPYNPGAHAVAIVGYGSEGGKDFWIIRNSWGPEWGEKGYMRMVRGKTMCALHIKVILPVVKK